MRARRFAGLLTLLALAAPTTARQVHAQAPVPAPDPFNGSFESGLSGWTATAGGGVTVTAVADCGSWAGWGDIGPGCARMLFPATSAVAPGAAAFGEIRQRITGLVVGQKYDVAFVYRLTTLFAPTSITTTFASFLSPGTVSCAPPGSCQHLFSAVASAAEEDFAIRVNRNATSATLPEGAMQIDRVLVTVNTVPEPGTWALLGTGLAALGLIAQRRRLTA